MEPEMRPTTDAPAAAKPRARRWIRAALVALLALAVFIAVLPHLASIGPIRNLLLRVALPKIDGSVHAGSAQLGWLSPVRFGQIEIRSPDGQPVAAIARLEGDRPLWRMVFTRELGQLRIERPQVDVVVDGNGTNLSRVFAGRKPEEKKIRRPPNVALAVQLIDGRASVRGADSARPWTTEPVNFAFRLRPASATPDGQPRLEIEPGVVVADTQLTPEACRDLLKYIAPVLAGATEASGRFSIELDRWDLPLADFARGEGSGRLTIHDLTVGPGPLVHELATVLKIPPRTIAVENAPVVFRLAGGRIHHSELTFRLQRLVIRTSGSVGVEDKSLAMTAELSLPESAAADSADRPLLAALAKTKVRIPIAGTLQKPKIDGRALVRSLFQGSDEGVIDNLLKNGQADLTELLKAFRERREERRKRQELDQQANPPQRPADESRRPLRNLLRGVLDEATKAAGSGQ